MTGGLYVGTSGYDYPQWRGSFYPPEIRRGDLLAHYAGRFPSVEINYSFRHEISPRTVDSWHRATPEGFVFSLKAHQRITHFLRLSGAGEAVEAFVGTARPLGERLGPILFQLPPNLPFNRPLVDRFLGTLPPDLRFAFEFRHPSWSEAKPILASHGLAWCAAETDEQPITGGDVPATPFAYLRLRRTDYSARDLEAWAGRLSSMLSDGVDVFCYFKHEEAGAGAAFAGRLLDLLHAERPAGRPPGAPRPFPGALPDRPPSPATSAAHRPARGR